MLGTLFTTLTHRNFTACFFIWIFGVLGIVWSTNHSRQIAGVKKYPNLSLCEMKRRVRRSPSTCGHKYMDYKDEDKLCSFYHLYTYVRFSTCPCIHIGLSRISYCFSRCLVGRKQLWVFSFWLEVEENPRILTSLSYLSPSLSVNSFFFFYFILNHSAFTTVP